LIILALFTNFEFKSGRNGRKKRNNFFYKCRNEFCNLAWENQFGKSVVPYYMYLYRLGRNLFQEGKGEELAHVDEDEDREPEVEEVCRVPPEHLLGEEHQHGVLNLEAVHT
jgi:hypothetical protein